MNSREFRVIGLSRSGNHAIINWILKQARGRTCFLNCAEPKSNPFESARPLDDGRRAIASYADFDLCAERARRFSRKDLFMFSHEDCFLGSIARSRFEHEHDAYVGRSDYRADILILRDPFNLFASRRKAGIGEVSASVALRIWKQHAREYLGERRYLRLPRILTNYNLWCARRAYRAAAAAELGLEFDDLGSSEVPAAANGSSFDGRRFHGRAAGMATARRWRYFADDPAFHRLFDDETHALAAQIFADTGYGGARNAKDDRVAGFERKAILG
jgi:hypothetical protein